MKTTFKFVVGAMLLAACSSSESTTPAEVDEQAARAKVSEAVPGGTIASVSKLDEAEEHRWAASVKLANGAELNVEIERATGVLAEIEGEKGPFDYDLPAPANGYLTYAQARTKALAAKAGDIELWEVKTDKVQYEFYVREPSTTRLYEIKLDATNGTVTTLVEKDKPD